MEWRRVIATGKDAVEARLEIVAALAALPLDLDVPAVDIILGELFGNVARHAPGPTAIRLLVSARGERVDVEVVDSGPGFGLQSDPAMPPPGREGGRGVPLVFALSEGAEIAPAHTGGAALRVRLPRRNAVSAPKRRSVKVERKR